MALFLAGLRSVDGEIIKAAQVDGIPTHRIYTAIIIPSMAPIFLSAFIVLSHLAIKSFDLVIALTGGRPRLRHRPARDLHVCHGIFARRHWPSGVQRNGHDDDRFRHCGALPLFRIEGET